MSTLAKPDNGLPVSLEDLRKVFMPEASEGELLLAFGMCKAQGLNPFKGEVYFVPFKDKSGKLHYQIIPSYTVFLKRAMSNPQYAGFRAGIIVETKDGGIEYREGAFKGKNEKLLGGWCEVYRKDWQVPLKHSVNLEEFDRRQNNWEKMKAFMIMKVAIAQAHRFAFPEELSGLYIAEELEETQTRKTQLLAECYQLVKENPQLKKLAEDFVRSKGKKHSTELEIDELEELRDLLLEAKG